MSTILRRLTAGTRLMLYLSCGHRYLWSGKQTPHVGEDFPCPECQVPTVEQKK